MSDKNELQVIVAESGLPETKAQTLLEKFSGYFAMAAEWEAKSKVLVVTDEKQIAEMKMAREGRLFLKAKRVELEKTRVALKADVNREGKAIDGIANVLKALIVPIEEYLDNQEHFIEHKRAAEEEARRIEADRLLAEKEEADRIAREKEIKAQAAENVRLKKEADEREAAAEKERKAAALKLEEQEAQARAEQDRIRAEEQEKREKAEAKAERERKRLKKEADDKLAAERKRLKKEADDNLAAERKRADAKDEALAKKHAEEMRLASMVTCPHCGHEFSTEDV